MELSNEEIEFKELLREKKHKEVVGMLMKIYERIPTDLTVDIPEGETFDYDRMESIISGIKVSAPDSTPGSIQLLIDTLTNKMGQFVKQLEDLKTGKPEKWTFKVVRNNNGLIELVEAQSINS